MNTSSKSRLYPIWLLALILPVGGRYRHVLTAAVIMVLLWLVLDALGGKADHYEKLFFAAVIAYMITIFSRIVMQSQRALDEIARELVVPEDMDEGWDWVTVFPGLAASFAPALLLFIIPVWPLHKRLQGARQSMLLAVDDDVRELGPISEARIREGAAIDQFNRLLVMRREVQQISTRPFDGTNLLRIAFYLLLIPLTWVGAALVENLVDLFLV